jgi:hypothetical protein
MASSVCSIGAVVGGHDEHRDVGQLGAARAHLGEGLVARRVEEGDRRAAARAHRVGRGALGDAAGLARGHLRLAQRVEQRGLAVVDVAEHGHDRVARLELAGELDLALPLVLEQPVLLRLRLEHLDLAAHLDRQLEQVLLDEHGVLVARVEGVGEVHQDLARLDAEHLGQLAHADRRAHLDRVRGLLGLLARRRPPPMSGRRPGVGRRTGGRRWPETWPMRMAESAVLSSGSKTHSKPPACRRPWSCPPACALGRLLAGLAHGPATAAARSRGASGRAGRTRSCRPSAGGGARRGPWA